MKSNSEDLISEMKSILEKLQLYYKRTSNSIVLLIYQFVLNEAFFNKKKQLGRKIASG